MIGRDGSRSATLACLGLLGSLIAGGTACSPEPLSEPIDLAGHWLLSDSVTGFSIPSCLRLFGRAGVGRYSSFVRSRHHDVRCGGDYLGAVIACMKSFR
jgi:hypothetical protein